MRRLVAIASVSVVAACGGRPPAPTDPDPFTDLDRSVGVVLDEYAIRGASVAITYRGRLVHRRAFGHPRGDDSVATTPDTRFRIASLTKPITSVAIHRLHQQGELDLDARIVPLLGLRSPDPGRFDPRWNAITVRHLLTHTAGFDRDRSFDPMFANATFAKMFERAPEPDSLAAIVSVMLQRPLDFDPGTAQAYSNFGYALLGLVVEKVSGMRFDAFIRERILAPIGIRRIELGRELPGDRPDDEAFYFPDPDDVLLPNLFSDAHELVPPCDGGFYFAPMAAHGGFIASASEYARFLVHVDGFPDPPDLLEPSELESMLARPPLDSAGGRADYYADGWDVIPTESGRIWSHTGAKPGTTSLAVRLPNGVCYVALANGRPFEGDFVEDLDVAILDALERVDRFPERDLFDGDVQPR